MVNFWGLVEPLAKYQDQKPNLELCSFSVNQLPRFLNSYMQSNGGAEGRNKERMFILYMTDQRTSKGGCNLTKFKANLAVHPWGKTNKFLAS